MLRGLPAGCLPAAGRPSRLWSGFLYGGRRFSGLSPTAQPFGGQVPSERLLVAPGQPRQGATAWATTALALNSCPLRGSRHPRPYFARRRAASLSGFYVLPGDLRLAVPLGRKAERSCRPGSPTPNTRRTPPRVPQPRKRKTCWCPLEGHQGDADAEGPRCSGAAPRNRRGCLVNLLADSLGIGDRHHERRRTPCPLPAATRRRCLCAT